MNGLNRLWALGAKFERLAAERATVTVDGRPLWRVLLDIAAQIEREHAEPGGRTLPGLRVLGLDFKELREGEKVWSTRLGKLVTISHVRPNGTVTLYNHGCTPFRSLDFTHEVPALDADGVEIRAGDVPYSIETGESVTVESVEPGNPWFAAASGTLQHCGKFTHRVPVIAADGKPLREKNIVFDKVSGEKLGVDAVDAGDVTCRRLERDGAVVHYNPDLLTHDRPDSWERLEEDVGKQPYAYCVGNGLFGAQDEDEEMTPTNELFARDLVRRAKKLAGAIG